MTRDYFKSSRQQLLHKSAGLILPLLLLSASADAQSLLWKISGKAVASPSFLYGTIHLTDPRVFEWHDSVYRQLGMCRAFASELDLSMENMMKAAGMMLLPEGQTLHDRFSEQEYNIVREAVKSCSGLELSLFDKVKPPALIALCFNGKHGTHMEATVDELLYKKAKTDGLATYGIETIEEQIGILDKIPDSYVLEYFKKLDKQNSELEKLIRSYRRADLDSLWLLIQDEESGALLTDEMIRMRNYRMSERIIPMITKESTFIAVGSGHLPGDEGLIAILRKAGYHVEPVRLW